MSNMLIDDRPIMFLPMLAKALGSCERAIVLQQIHWLSRQPNSGTDADGYHWVWGTYDDWARDYFPMWSPHTLAKVIRKLEDSGVLVSAQLRAHEHNHTKYYRVDYAALDAMLPDQVASIVPDSIASNASNQAASINSTETSSENTAKSQKRPPRAQKPEEKRNYRPDEYSDIILG